MDISKFTAKAATIFKEEGGQLTMGFEISIVDGVVEDIKVLNAPNLPVISVGKAQERLWDHYRNQALPKSEVNEIFSEKGESDVSTTSKRRTKKS